MLNNKRGLSEAVMTVIMIALVLVAVGVIWVVVQNVINKNTQQIDYSNKCMGIVIDPSQPTYASGVYSVTLTRPVTSIGTSIDGVEVVVSNETTSTNALRSAGDIAVSKTVTITTAQLGGTISAVAKPYFNDTKAGVLRYCTPSVYPKQ